MGRPSQSRPNRSAYSMSRGIRLAGAAPSFSGGSGSFLDMDGAESIFSSPGDLGVGFSTDGAFGGAGAGFSAAFGITMTIPTERLSALFIVNPWFNSKIRPHSFCDPRNF